METSRSPWRQRAPGPLARTLVVIGCLALCPHRLVAANEPFVIGYERFARHGDIDTETSGRLLLSELNCTACHRTELDALEPKGGPLLHQVGLRVRADWLRTFLRDPSSAKPGTTMPDLLHGMGQQEEREAIKALVAYLSSLTAPFRELKASGIRPIPYQFWKQGDAGRGKDLYHEIGCVACHEPDPQHRTVQAADSPVDKLFETLTSEELEEMGLADAARRVPSIRHPDLAAKYTPKALTYFLIDPQTVRPSARMPDFQLTPVEAADLAAYLIARSENAERVHEPTNAGPASTAGSPSAAGLVAKGRDLFQKLGCQNCHATEKNAAVLAATPLSGLKLKKRDGCLRRPQRKHASYSLTEQQTEALVGAIEKAAHELASTAPVDPHVRLLKLNCYACHERTGLGGLGRFRQRYMHAVGRVDLGDEGRLPPPLTGVGRKLRPAAIRAVVSEELRIRPHMQIRMPRYAATIGRQLARAFETVDRKSEVPSRESMFAAVGASKFSEDELAEAGREMMDIGCVQCHQFRGHALPGVLGIDLESIDQRIHPDWFKQFLLDPASIKPRTRMPTFFPEGNSQARDILGGDVQLQLAAIWTYLSQLRRRPLPAKIEEARSRDYELRPTERPIVLRTFMEAAGTHAIAVGFPTGVHFAFDAEQVRPAVVWKGRFLDARGTWFSRFAPPAPPLGSSITLLPAGPDWWSLQEREDGAVSGQPGRPSFDGYRLDADKVPVFLYSWNGLQIQDRLTAGDDQSLVRNLAVSGDGHGTDVNAMFRLAAGSSVKHADGHSLLLNSGLRIVLQVKGTPPPQLQPFGETSDWMVPLNGKPNLNLEVHYRW